MLVVLEKNILPSKYQVQLEVDEIEEKLYLGVYDCYDNLIERESFVYLKSLYDHLVLKLNRLAIVYASQKMIDEQKHFRYYKINIYQLKSFDTFINLLKHGVIKVSLIARISKSGSDIGRYRNKNLVFMLKKDKIEMLFDEIYTYNYDY